MPSREVGRPPTQVGGPPTCYVQYYTLDTPRCPSRKTPRRGTARRNGSEERLGETAQRNGYDEAPYGNDHHILGSTIVSRCPCADLHCSTQCSAPRTACVRCTAREGTCGTFALLSRLLGSAKQKNSIGGFSIRRA
jgi:hypothetical protein